MFKSFFAASRGPEAGARLIVGLALLAVAAALAAQTNPSAVPATAPILAPAPAPTATPALYDQLAPACVEVLVGGHLNGSGAVVAADGLVLTAAHVVDGQRPIEVMSPALGRVPAKLLAVDIGHDLALLEFARPNPAPACATLPLAAEAPAVMEEIYLFGSPIYRHHLLIRGQVAGKGTAFEWANRCGVEVFHVTANTPRGTSGGAWVNSRGQIVGVQSSMMSEGAAQNGIGFVSPLIAIRRLLETRKSAATPTLSAAAEELWEHPWDFIDKFPKGTEGIVLRAMDPTGPAARAGLLDMDLVISVNDKPVRLRDDFFRLIRAEQPEQNVKLLVRRPNENPRAFVVKLGKEEKD